MGRVSEIIAAGRPRLSDPNAGSETEHVKDPEIEPHGGYARRKARAGKIHCQRWWCFYVIGVVVFLAIFLPVFLLVAIPAIAQRMLDDADLPIEAGMLMVPMPETIHLSLVASIKIPAPFSVRVEPIPLSLYQPGYDPSKPFVKIVLPETRLKGTSQISAEDQQVDILDAAQFREFISSYVFGETFTLGVKGSTTAHMGKLKSKVTIDKQLKVNALNRVAGFAIESVRLLLPPPDDGALIAATMSIPNPSNVTFELGNVTLNVLVGGFRIGTARLYDVVIKPGNNTLPARVDADVKAAFANISGILESQSEFLKRGTVELTAVGNSTTYKGKRLEYYEASLNRLELRDELSILGVLTDTLGGFLSDNPGLLRNLTTSLNGTAIAEALTNTGVSL